LGCVIGHPIACVVLPAIVGVLTMASSRAESSQNHGLRIEQIREAQSTAYVTQASFNKPRDNFVRVRRILEMAPIDDKVSCVISDIGQMGILVVHRD